MLAKERLALQLVKEERSGQRVFFEEEKSVLILWEKEGERSRGGFSALDVRGREVCSPLFEKEEKKEKKEVCVNPMGRGSGESR